MERTPEFIKVWFWPRHADDVPADVRGSISGWINTDTWGTPTAYFPDTHCDIYRKFAPSNIIIVLTFCESLYYLSTSVYVVTEVCGIQVENGQARNTAFQDALVPAKVRCVRDWVWDKVSNKHYSL
jgi:hypothetical protein